MANQEIDYEKLKEVWDKTVYSLDSNIHKTIVKQEEYLKNIIQNTTFLKNYFSI